MKREREKREEKRDDMLSEEAWASLLALIEAKRSQSRRFETENNFFEKFLREK